MAHSDMGAASGFDVAPNTNAMDENSMTSDTAQAARERAKEIMNALGSGQPGDADKLMGKREPKASYGLVETEVQWQERQAGQGRQDYQMMGVDAGRLLLMLGFAKAGMASLRSRV